MQSNSLHVINLAIVQIQFSGLKTCTKNPVNYIIQIGFLDYNTEQHILQV